MEYYVSGVKADANGNCEICDDAEANFWTLYERNDSGESQAIVDCQFRKDAEAAMQVYQERDALQQQVNALAAENSSIKDSIAIHAAGFSVCPVCGHEKNCATDDIVLMLKEDSATDAIEHKWMANGLMYAIEELSMTMSMAGKLNDLATQLRAGEQGGDHV